MHCHNRPYPTTAVRFQERKAEWYIYHPLKKKKLADLKASSVLANVETVIPVVLFRVFGAGPSLVWSLLCLGWCRSWLPRGRNPWSWWSRAVQNQSGKGRAELSGWSAEIWPYAVLLFSLQMSLILEKMEDVFHWSVLNVGRSSFTKVTLCEQHWCFLSMQWLGAGYCTSWKPSQSKVM